MPSDELWNQMVNVLKDISSYLEKQDSEEKDADLDIPPKINEGQDEMVGGSDPSGEPGVGMLEGKFKTSPETSSKREKIKGDEKTNLKKAEEDEKEESDEDEKDKEDEDEENEVNEMKSLLKDISSALNRISKSSETPSDFSQIVGDEIKKALPSAMDKMLRKMGYSVSKPDVMRLDVDNKFGIEASPDIKKSGDGKSSEGQGEDLTQRVDELSKMSWQKLGQMRYETGDFNVFPR